MNTFASPGAGIADPLHSGPFASIVRLARRLFDVPVAMVTLDGTNTAEQTPWATSDARSDPDAWAKLQYHDVCAALPGLTAFAAAALRSADGAIIGSLSIATSESREFTSEDLQHLDDLAALAALRFQAGAAAAVQAELLEVAHHEHRRSLHDALTGVLNRAGISAVLDSALASGRTSEGVTVVVTDVDRFKTINDTLGHAAGDDVIKAVASRLNAATRDRDAVGRLGGDEFLMVLSGCGDQQLAEQVAGRMFESIRANPIRLRRESSPKDAHVTLSMGVAVIPAGIACRPEDALELADQAMYEAKRAGRDQLSVVVAPRVDAA